MTEKRFNDAKGYVYDGKNCIGIIVDDYTCENIINLLNELAEENEQLKQELEYQQEVIVNAIDSLMDLPSATIYLIKQWLDVFEDFDSIEDVKNTFHERMKELKE